MNALLVDGPLAGRLYPGLHGGDRLERTDHDRTDDETIYLAVYTRTCDTVPVELEHDTREGVVRRPAAADVFTFDDWRVIPRSDPRRRRELRPGEQATLV